MNKKGIGSVVGYVIFILIAVVGASILIGAYLKSVQKDTSGDSSSCFGLDLKVNSCLIVPNWTLYSYTGINDSNHALLMNIERLPGRGDIKGLRFAVTDSSGNVHVEEPVVLRWGNEMIDVDYSDFIEYTSTEAFVRNLSYLSTPTASAAVSAVVGSSETICAPTRPAVKCIVFGT